MLSNAAAATTTAHVPLSPSPSAADSEDDADIPVEFRDTEEYKELIKLQRLTKLQKKRQSPAYGSSSSASTSSKTPPPTATNEKTSIAKPPRYTTLAVHHGYKCDHCGSEPIVGGRWKCQECQDLDLCDSCHLKDYMAHSRSHSMSFIETPEANMSFTGDEYSYLVQ